MKRIVTGLKPTGELTLGNYIGVIKPLVDLQDDYEIILFVADLHAITTKQDKAELRRLIKEFSALYLACGIDKDKVKIFIQSEIQAHAQLGYILMCQSYIGELNRMTQYKDKVLKEGHDSLTAGFYTYPSLMAADILIYDADIVYVGNDQKQHVELTKTIANRFNNEFGDTFKVPVVMTNKSASRIMDLQNPLKKMSKSENNKGCILLKDDINAVRNKIRRAITDNDSKIYFDKLNKPGISNLMEIYTIFSDCNISEVEEKYKYSTYKDFKEDLANIVCKKIEEIQKSYEAIINSNTVDEVFNNGYLYCNKIANTKLNKVENKLGLNRKSRGV